MKGFFASVIADARKGQASTKSGRRRQVVCFAWSTSRCRAAVGLRLSRTSPNGNKLRRISHLAHHDALTGLG